MRTLYFITSNKGKFLEVTEKLQPLGFSVVQKDLGYPEIQAERLEDVVGQGVSYVQMRCKHPFILEDSGLFITALHGFPGVYSKYVFFTIGLPGILRLMHGVKNRQAIFQSVYAYSEPSKKPIISIGKCNGTISFKQRGDNGFGYDPIFLPNGVGKTFGEMTMLEKNRYSHRSKAIDNLIFNLKKRE